MAGLETCAKRRRSRAAALSVYIHTQLKVTETRLLPQAPHLLVAKKVCAANPGRWQCAGATNAVRRASRPLALLRWSMHVTRLPSAALRGGLAG